MSKENRLIEKIMVFIDGTEEALTAAMYGICLAKTMNAECIAVYVVDQSSLNELLKTKIFVKAEEAEYTRDLEEDGKRYLSFVEKLAKEKEVNVSLFLLKGTVYEEVLKKIKDEKVDLLILSKLEETVSRLDNYYDENERLLRSSPCPVIILKGHKKIEKFFEDFI